MKPTKSEVKNARENLVRYFNRLCCFDKFPSKAELGEVDKYWQKIMKTDVVVLKVALLELLSKEAAYKTTPAVHN
jgi:hypothetical protein